MSDRLIAELVQVSAVACATIEDLKFGEANWSKTELNNFSQGELVQMLVHNERIRQDEKWGTRHLTPMEWLMILTEESGETAEEVGLLPEDTADELGLSAEIIAMLVDVGNLARRWLEAHEWPARQQEVVDREVPSE